MRYQLATNDKQDFYMVFHGSDFYFSLWDLDQYLRNQVKHNPNKLSGEQLDAIEKVREQLNEIMSEYGVDFNHIE
jgi:hypothetical protein